MIAVPTQPLVSIISNVSLDPNVGYENRSLRRMQEGRPQIFCTINLPDKRIFIRKLIKHLHPIAIVPSAAHVTESSNGRSILTEAGSKPWARRQGHGVAIQSPPSGCPPIVVVGIPRLAAAATSRTSVSGLSHSL